MGVTGRAPAAAVGRKRTPPAPGHATPGAVAQKKQQPRCNSNDRVSGAVGVMNRKGRGGSPHIADPFDLFRPLNSHGVKV